MNLMRGIDWTDIGAHFVPRLQGGDVGLNRELGLGAVPLQAITSWAFSPPKPVRVSRGVWRLAG